VSPTGYRSLAAAVLAALVLAGCGSSSSSQPSGPRSWTLQQFLRLSGLRRSADGLSYRLPNHPRCVARILLRSNAEVQTYTNAGDVVATNPDKSAGVRVEPGEPPSCKAVFTQALAHVK
jgi:nitrous oxide reductase accessory protein NosL